MYGYGPGRALLHNKLIELTRKNGGLIDRLFYKPARDRRHAVAIARVALGHDVDKVELDPGGLWTCIASGHCPDCGGEGFYDGPSGGMSTNISCATCKHEFNVTPVIGQAERI